MDVYFVTDRTLCTDRSLVEIVREAVTAGVRYVQLREKDLPAGKLFHLARDLLGVCRGTPCGLLVNDRLDIALAAGADGVHLPRQGLPVAAVRGAVGKGFLIGASTHSLEEARRAESEGADFLVFGPIFPTPAKLRYGPPLGVDPLGEVLAGSRIPVYAIGGIHEGNIEILRRLPLGGVAVIRAIMGSGNVGETVRRLRGSVVSGDVC